MTDIACDICFHSYSEANNIPKVLNCGHTFCHLCVINLIKSQNGCPICETPLTKSVEEYPTNFIAFRHTKQESDLGYQTLKNIEKELVKRREILLKTNGERAAKQNLILGGIAKLGRISRVDAGTMNSPEVQNLIKQIETEIEIVDALECCGKLEIKPTYSAKEYTSTTFFMYDLAIRLQKGENIYAYKIIQNSKPKYGKVVFIKDRINIQALTLTKADKLSSLVSFEDLRTCITADKFRTFIKLGEETLSFSITDSSYLALRFVKLCSGENGPTFKGANIETPQMKTPRNKNRETPLSNDEDCVFWFISVIDEDVCEEGLPVEQYVHIEKYMLNEVETEGFDDYDFNIFCCAAKKTKCSVGESVVLMKPNGSCEIKKSRTTEHTYENVVAKLTEPGHVTLAGINPAVVNDCGISLLF